MIYHLYHQVFVELLTGIFLKNLRREYPLPNKNMISQNKNTLIASIILLT